MVIKFDHFPISIIVQVIHEKFPKKSNKGRNRVYSYEMILEDIFKVLRTGMQWNELNPSSGCSNKTIYDYFNRWRKVNLFEISYKRFMNGYYIPNMYKGSKYLVNTFTDASLVKNVNGSNCVGPNSCDRGRKGTKLMVTVEEYGIPISYSSHPANFSDCILIDSVFNNRIIDIPKSKSKKYPQRMICDKGFDSQTCREIIKKNNIIPIIPKRNKIRKRKKHNCACNCTYKRNQPKKKKRKKTKNNNPNYINGSNLEYYKRRYINEALFGWLDKYRRLIVRYDRHIQSYNEFTYLAFFKLAYTKMIKHFIKENF
jgi:transposase